MKKIFIYTALFATLAIACDKTDNEPIQKGIEPDSDLVMITEKVSANVNPSSKANVDADAKFTWLANDQIAVHVNDGNYYTANLTAGASTNSGTFTVTYPEGQSRNAFAIYPASIVAADAENYGQSGHSLDVTLPASYTLAQVSGTATPCPMIATNTPGEGWDFKQLCGFLRLTVNSIPGSTKRLEIDFDGKKVCGDFSIASPVTPVSSVIPTTDDANHDIITITKNGSNVTLGETSLVLNIPLPIGEYSNIIVVAYDALSGGNPLKCGSVSFSYTAARTRGIKREIAVTTAPLSFFTFTFKNKGSNLDNNLRFVRLFSNLNKLRNGATTYGPYTAAAVGTSDPNIDNPVSADLLFDRDSNDLIAFQVVTKDGDDGKVYAGLLDAPAGGFRIGKTYNLAVDVNTYTFTVASGKKVYFSPGDLGVDDGVYSFTEPFETWGWGDQYATRRVWFNYDEVHYNNVTTGHEIYGIKWRNVKSTSNKQSSTLPREWDYIISTRAMKSNVNSYYRVNIPNHGCCLLLTPDETTESDLDGLTDGADITNYAKFLSKGFVLLISTGRATVTSSWTWAPASSGYYWNYRVHQTQARFFITWSSNAAPSATTSSSQHRMRVRYVLDVQ